MLTAQNSVEFVLISKSLGRVVIPEPRNYDEGNGNIYQRDKDSKGFLTTRSNELEFINEGKDTIIKQFATKGIAEDLLLQKIFKDPYRLDERWRTNPPVFMDIGKYTEDEENNTIKVKSTQGGLYKTIKSNLSEKIDLIGTTSITGGLDIGALKTVTVPIQGRDILRISELSIEDGTRVQHIVSGGDRLNARSVPFQVDINSDVDDINSVQSPQWNAANDEYARPVGVNTSNAWYLIADQPTKLIINGRIELRVVDANSGTFNLDLVRYTDGDEFNYGGKVSLASVNPNQIGGICAYDFIDYEVNVNQGDSFIFGVITDTQDGVGYEIYNTAIIVREDSQYPESNCKAIEPLEVGDRLIAKITGVTGCFKSDMLSVGGKHHGKLLTQGYYAREFPDIIQEGTDEERKIQFTTSIKKFLQHLEAIEPIAWWTEMVGDKEVMRVEPLKYTQQNFNRIKFGETTTEFSYIQAQKVTREPIKGNFYGSLEFGSEKGGEDYEEVSGLQSISGNASFSTVNSTQSDTVYKRLSPYRLGDIDVELARRKPYSLYPEEDTRYDSDIMCIDCKQVNGRYYLKTWQDVYEVAPSNVYSVDTLFNPEFTPARFLLNHSYVINAGLYHYPSEKIRFNSSNCNSSFLSKKGGEDFILRESPPQQNDEDYGIEHSWLESPRIIPKSVKLTLYVDQQLEDQITGSTDGVPNWFGLVAVKTRGGIEYMRLVKTDTNKEGTHQLVEAFIDEVT